MTVFVAFAESIQLVPDGTLFLHIAIIIFMVFVLNRTLFNPIGRVLSGRERHTKGSSSEAQGILRDVEEKLSNYEQSLREARAESYRLIEERRSEAVQLRQQRLSSVRQQLEGSIERERLELQSQASEARVELETEARRLASSIGNQILGRQVG